MVVPNAKSALIWHTLNDRIVKGFRMPARRRREGVHGGRRSKSLEGGNRGGPRKRGSNRGPRCCASGLRRNQQSRSRPSRASGRIGALGSALPISQTRQVVRRGRSIWVGRVSALPASSRCRRNSSIQAQMVAKSSAGGGLSMCPRTRPFVAGLVSWPMACAPSKTTPTSSRVCARPDGGRSEA